MPEGRKFNLLNKILSKNFILYYWEGSNSYISNPNWERYQNIKNDRFKKSLFPSPESPSVVIINRIENRMETIWKQFGNKADTFVSTNLTKYNITEQIRTKSKDKDLLRNKSLLKILEKKQKAEEAKKWNDEFFEYWEKKIGENPRDEPAIRARYPRLIRQKCEKEKIDYDKAISWAWD